MERKLFITRFKLKRQCANGNATLFYVDNNINKYLESDRQVKLY